MKEPQQPSLPVARYGLLGDADRISTIFYRQSAHNAFAKPGEDWTRVRNTKERRKIQNRIAQRIYRKKIKKQVQELQRICAGGSPARQPLKPPPLKYIAATNPLSTRPKLRSPLISPLEDVESRLTPILPSQLEHTPNVAAPKRKSLPSSPPEEASTALQLIEDLTLSSSKSKDKSIPSRSKSSSPTPSNSSNSHITTPESQRSILPFLSAVTSPHNPSSSSTLRSSPVPDAYNIQSTTAQTGMQRQGSLQSDSTWVSMEMPQQPSDHLRYTAEHGAKEVYPYAVPYHPYSGDNVLWYSDQQSVSFGVPCMTETWSSGTTNGDQCIQPDPYVNMSWSLPPCQDLNFAPVFGDEASTLLAAYGYLCPSSERPMRPAFIDGYPVYFT